MLIKKPVDIKFSQITAKRVYLNRRLFMRGAALAATTAATALLYRKLNPPPLETPKGDKLGNVSKPSSESASKGFTVREKLTAIEDITNYNNFYEFSTNKQSVASESRGFVTKPWAVSVEGLVNKPKTFDLDELLRFPQEERVYRLRCVEGWSMVIPWVGFPLSSLLGKVEPGSQAKYVAFQTLFDPKRSEEHTSELQSLAYL